MSIYDMNEDKEKTITCGSCGKVVDKDCEYCPWCGAQFRDHVHVRETFGSVKKDDEIGGGAIALAILGFIIPFIGIIGALAELISGKNKAAGVIGLMTVIGMVFWFMFWGY